MTEQDATPLDDKIAQAERAEREAKDEVDRCIEARQEAETNRETGEAMRRYQAAREEHREAKARLTALRIARDRWRRAQEPRYRDVDNPEGPPLTLEELNHRQGIEG